MAINYTYEDFQTAAQNAGLLDQFSQSDLALAQTNPNAGMSILQYKIDYQNATTPEAKAAANAGAEAIRSSYGEYTGGVDGSGYYLNPMSPGSFTYDTAPEYTNPYAQTQQDSLDSILNYGDYTYNGVKPEYSNRYDSQIQDALDKVVNPGSFSYDAANDAIYQQYAKQYNREGQRATANALAEAAAATGGIPSSYAMTAAGQAGNYYASQLTDKIPELAQQAYQRYLGDYNMKQSALSALMSAEQSDYQKYLNDLSQYNTDRDFDYGTWVDRYGMLHSNLDAVNNLQQMDYNQYQDRLAQYNTDRNFAYGQYLDEIDSQTRERLEAWERAQQEFENNLNLGMLGAEYGDYSKLNTDFGINPNLTNVNNMALAGSGKYYGSSGNSGVTTYPAVYNGSTGSSTANTTTSSTGGGYNNGGLTDSQIREMQAYFGVTADGMWGANSTAASGGLTAQQAWAAYQANKEEGTGSSGQAENKRAQALQQAQRMLALGAKPDELYNYFVTQGFNDNEALLLMNQIGYKF